MRLSKISAALYQILDGSGANGGAYIGDSGVLLIDAKQDKKSVDQTIAEIRKITDKPIKYLVNTHSDGDHVAGNQFFPESITFIAQENCRKEFFHAGSRGTPSDWNKPELAPFIPSVTYRDRMDIYLGSKHAELWYFGVGHTTGDTVVYFSEEKTAFLGDQIFLTRPQLIHSYKGGNSFANVETLTKMLKTLDADKFCSGHSEMTDRKGVQDCIDRMKQKQQSVRSLMDKGKNLDEIKTTFKPEEAALIETIYNEIKQGAR